MRLFGISTRSEQGTYHCNKGSCHDQDNDSHQDSYEYACQHAHLDAYHEDSYAHPYPYARQHAHEEDYVNPYDIVNPYYVGSAHSDRLRHGSNLRRRNPGLVRHRRGRMLLLRRNWRRDFLRC